jgi:hypothetical protein
MGNLNARPPPLWPHPQNELLTPEVSKQAGEKKDLKCNSERSLIWVSGVQSNVVSCHFPFSPRLARLVRDHQRLLATVLVGPEWFSARRSAVTRSGSGIPMPMGTEDDLSSRHCRHSTTQARRDDGQFSVGEGSARPASCFSCNAPSPDRDSTGGPPETQRKPVLHSEGSSPSWRPVDDPRSESDYLQHPAGNRPRPSQHNAAQPLGENAVSGCDESVDAAAIHECKVGEVDHDGRARYLDQGTRQPIGGHDVQLAVQCHDVDIGQLAGGKTEIGHHGEAISAEGCRWQVARGSVSCLQATPIEATQDAIAGRSASDIWGMWSTPLTRRHRRGGCGRLHPLGFQSGRPAVA